MQLTDGYDGAGDPFEGDRTVPWRSLPENAVVTRATLTLEPRLPPGKSSFVETLRLGPTGPSYGATVSPQDSTSTPVEIDFHARRRALACSGLKTPAAGTVTVDIGGGVFLAVAKDGTVPALAGGPVYDASSGNLPGISAQRLRFPQSSLSGTPDQVSIDVATLPSNLTLRFGKLPTFWSKVGELSTATVTPDITDAMQRALAQAAVVDGFYVLPLVIHSDTLGRIKVTLNVEYLGSVPLVAPGLREVVLPYDYASVTTTDPNALQAKLPANARILAPQTSLQVRGAFAASRVAYGPTGTTHESSTVHCSATETLAQPVIPTADIDVSAVDLFVASDGPAARLALDLRSDLGGKPAPASLLSKPASFDLAGTASGNRQWTSVPISPGARLNAHEQYWIVVQAIDGAAFLGIDTPADSARLLQRSTDSGFSWRRAGLSSPLLLRLRTVPDRFHMPVDFTSGVGATQQRVSLQAYDPLGKVDALLNRPEIAAAVQSYVAQSAASPCATGERLQNSDFSQWSSAGTAFGHTVVLEAPGTGELTPGPSLALFDTFFDTQIAAVPAGSLDAFAFSSDGATLYAGSSTDHGIQAIDLSSLESSTLITDPPYQGSPVALATDVQGQALYTLEPKALTAIDLATLKARVILDSNTLTNAQALALSKDGRSLYVADNSTVIALDLITGTQQWLLTMTTSALGLSADGAALIVIDGHNNRLAALDTRDGTTQWTAYLPGKVFPSGIAVAANGAEVYAVGPGSTPTGPAILAAFDSRGRLTQQVGVDPLFTPADLVAIAVKPQGDRVYVSTGPAALDPAGSRLIARTDSVLEAVYVGSRQPTAWTLTAGTIAPQMTADDPPQIEASLTEGSISQVIAISPGCFHDLTVNAQVPAGKHSVAGAVVAVAADGVAEVFWLDANGALLRADSLPLPTANQLVTQHLRMTPPPTAAQAEVRIRVAGGAVLLKTVSLQASDALLQPTAWQPAALASTPLGPAPPATPIAATATPTAAGTTFRNPGAVAVSFTQTLKLSTTGDYELNFEGTAALSASMAAPFIVLSFQDATGAVLGSPQQVTLDAIAFTLHPARVAIPASSTTAEVAVNLPPGTSVFATLLDLTPQPTVSVPCGFIAQSPGELHVSNARVVYDSQTPPPPVPPAGGLSAPTPPDRNPGEETCGVSQPATAASAQGAPKVLPPPATKPNALARLVMSGRPSRAASQEALSSTKPPQPEALPALTSIKGVAEARARRLQAAGIRTLRDLAQATPEQVTAALAGSPAVTPELVTGIIARAQAALAAQKPGS